MVQRKVVVALIDRMVCQDSHSGKRNVSMAWVDVRKAYDSVDHGWLREMFTVHREHLSYG